MSGDPEQEYFPDGVVEDIITALSFLMLKGSDLVASVDLSARAN